MKTENKLIEFYRKWYSLPLLIIVVSILIALFFSIILGKEFNLINFIFPSLFNTLVIWLGSMGIVMLVWKSCPWESQPLKHLIIEIALIVALLTSFILFANWYYSVLYKLDYAESFKKNTTDILFTVMITFLIVTIHEAIFFYNQWKINFSKSVKLEKENIEARYNALKAQVNPHFLFNSLNSLMTLIDDKPDAEKYLQDLSDYMRYMLVSNHKDLVTLEEEYNNVQKYIHLQQQRFGTNFSVSYEVKTTSSDKLIPVLSLQILLENCFNHNIVTHDKPLKIRIYEHDDYITVENNLQKKASGNSTGQGLKNIEGRYQLRGNRNIKINQDTHFFAVSIPLLDKNDYE